LWPTLFAYQFVVEAEVRSLEASRGEGLIFGQDAPTPGDDAGEDESPGYEEEPETTPRRVLVRAGHISGGLAPSSAGRRPSNSLIREEDHG
jgi:hypothetical protein